MVFRRGNPALNPEHFRGGMSAERMTLDGTINKTLTLLGLIAVTGTLAYSITSQSPGSGAVMMFGGMFGGIIMAFIIMMTRPANPQVLITMYALLEGLFIGSFSFMIENYYLGGNEGVIFQALIGTAAVFMTMLTLYRFRVIKPTEKYILAVVSMTGAIMMVYLVNMIMSLFGSGVPFLHSSGPIGIGISIVFTGVAALFLIIDFGMIENGVKYGAPKNMEWYGAFGLVMTLIWLYIEMIKLIAKLRD
tara:strand:- start:175 stop:918 length:744 start_codon:yes stop_codon:yes gene_type:complete